MKNITDQYVQGLYQLSRQEFSKEAIHEAKKCLLDYLGVTFAGAHMLKEKSKKSLKLFNSQGAITVVGLGLQTSVQEAILFNGIHAHVAELDDGHRMAMMHPGAPVISALMPLVQQNKISGLDFLKGIIMGYEASVRLASALQPSLKEKGFHGTGIAGTIGTAVALATVLKFNEVQFKDAIAAASTSASGILKVIKDISELKPFNVGNAAQSGYVSAMLALSGFRGSYDALGGTLGFMSIFSDTVKNQFLDFKDTDDLSIFKIYRKPYAACRHGHSPIEAAILLKENKGIKVNDIKAVDVKIYYHGVAGHDHTEIVGINSAKMSTPYGIAVALTKGKAGLAEFSEAVIQDKDILALTSKVTVVEDEELTRLVPEKRAAIVRIETYEGQVFTQRVDYPKGEPENPISDAELNDKFNTLAQFAGKTESECKVIVDVIENIETESFKLVHYL